MKMARETLERGLSDVRASTSCGNPDFPYCISGERNCFDPLAYMIEKDARRTDLFIPYTVVAITARSNSLGLGVIHAALVL
jgi:hypothetical protein